MSLAVVSMSIPDNPSIHQWLDFSQAGRVTLLCGKVEIGQGIETAMIQIAADTLGLGVERFAVRSGDTHVTPNEGYTAGSMSIEIGGAAVKIVATAARTMFVEEAARRLGAAPDQISVADGALLLNAQPTGLDYWALAGALDLHRPITAEASWSRASAGDLLGTNVPRIDLLAKVTGAAFVHDIELPGMLHARVLRPPSFRSKLVSLDLAGFAQEAPGARVWRSGDFVALVAAKEYDAVRALETLRKYAAWTQPEDLPVVEAWPTYLAAQPSLDDTTEAGQRLPAGAKLTRVEATYSRPPIAHGSIAPSCSLAQFADGVLTVHGSSQNVFNARNAIALALELEPDTVRFIHNHSAGCYGHNGADDSAMDAAIVAMAFAPAPVRVQWSREDELSWAPFGSAMAVKIDGAVDAAGDIADWSTEIWSGPHCKRPGFVPGLIDLLGASHLDPPKPISNSRDVPLAFIGCDRNAEPPYKLARLQVTRHKLPDLPFRFSSLRTLGGFANVFAVECFMDELALEAGLDPIEFRLKNLEDPRARGVIEAVAKMTGGPGLPSAEPGCAWGFAYSRYKNTAAYLAAIADVEVGEEVRVRRVFAAVDAGLPINPDGLINQIEGGIIQAVSWALMEQVTFDSRAITSATWERYPIYRFTDVPEVSVEIVDPGGAPPLGVGEAAQGPAAAAVANAVASALGVRVRDLPITRDNIVRALNL